MPERILICGDRYWRSLPSVERELAVVMAAHEVECVIEGECRGADVMGRLAARKLGVEVKPFPADWSRFGKAAGPIRNQQMLDEGKPTMVLAFHARLWESSGTADMIRRAQRLRLSVTLVTT